MGKKPAAAELLAAIRRKCMDCSGNMRSEVQGCKIRACPLYGYRRNAMENEEKEKGN